MHHHRLLWWVAASMLGASALAQTADDASRSEAQLPAQTSAFAAAPAQLEVARFVLQPSTEDAVAAAQRLVDSAEREHGRASPQSAEARTHLAELQRNGGLHDAAAASYLAAIEIVQTIDGPSTPRAIAPLIALGETYQASDWHVEALAAFSEARNLIRRAYGLHDEAQLEVLNLMTASLVREGQFVEADTLQRDAMLLVTRRYPPHAAPALAAVYRYARWLGQIGEYPGEREQYFAAVQLIREHYGTNSVLLVEPLQAIGNSYRRARLPDSLGSEALSEALEILEDQEQPSALKIAEVLRDLGDWNVAIGSADGGEDEYRRAWQLLEGIEGGDRVRAQWFEGVRYVVEAPFDMRPFSRESDALEGYVLVRFKVGPTGHAWDVEVLESVPPRAKDGAVLKHVKQSIFRPQIVDGEVDVERPIAARFKFRYVPTPAE